MARTSFKLVSRRTAQAATIAAAVAFVSPIGVQAQETQSTQHISALEEVIVTARKREETLMQTPVVIQAFTAEKLDQLQINDFQDFATVAPGLRLNQGTGGVGATAFLRGIGNGDSASFVDQSVLLNVDGVPQTHGAFYKTGLFDVAQIEVLKGPQALFFGKSASAGIISVQTADPGPDFESSLNAGYEFKAREFRTEGVISGPLTEAVGARLAAFYSDMGGFIRNLDPNIRRSRRPDGDEYGARLTLKYDAGGAFRGRAKLARYESETTGLHAFENQVMCVGARPQKPGHEFDDCKINNTSRSNPDGVPYRPDLDYSLGSLDFFTGSPTPLARDGQSYSDTKTTQGMLELEYDLNDSLVLTSVTGYGRIETEDGGRAIIGPASGGVGDVLGRFTKKDITQELRLSSHFSGPVNFMVGAFYDDSKSFYNSYLGLPMLTIFNDNRIHYENETYSAFAQLDFQLSETLELSAGVRYTKVKQGLTSIVNTDNLPDSILFGDPNGDGEQIGLVPEDDRSYSEDNFSPELTLSYKPNNDFMAYGSVKWGYKGPGYNVATVAFDAAPPNLNAPFEGEKVRGGEIGVKTRLLDGQLSLTSAIYHYKYKKLQVSFVENDTFQFSTRNGADAVAQGIELGLAYAPMAVRGLTLNAFVNYNEADYDSFRAATCYTGQTEATGCVMTAEGPVQDLTNRQMHRAPRWQGTVGGNYRFDVAGDLEGQFALNTNFSSKSNVTPELIPSGVQGAYATVDATFSFGKLGGAWEVALIGRNLTNKYYMFSGLDDGYVAPGSSVPDVIGYVNRGRQFMLQFTVRPHLF